MSKKSGFMKALKCRECGREYPLEATHVCEFDFGPLEVAYDYDKIKKSLTKDSLAKRPQTMWRFRELLPVAEEPTVGTGVGYTPLVKADRLAKWLGVREAWVKNDAVNYPTLSFKDRVVSVALSCAILSAKASGLEVTRRKAPSRKKTQRPTTRSTVEKGKSMSEGIVRKTAHASCTIAMAMRSCLRHRKTSTTVTTVSTAMIQKPAS